MLLVHGPHFENHGAILPWAGLPLPTLANPCKMGINLPSFPTLLQIPSPQAGGVGDGDWQVAKQLDSIIPPYPLPPGRHEITFVHLLPLPVSVTPD